MASATNPLADDIRPPDDTDSTSSGIGAIPNGLRSLSQNLMTYARPIPNGLRCLSQMTYDRPTTLIRLLAVSVRPPMASADSCDPQCPPFGF